MKVGIGFGNCQFRQGAIFHVALHAQCNPN